MSSTSRISEGGYLPFARNTRLANGYSLWYLSLSVSRTQRFDPGVAAVTAPTPSPLRMASRQHEDASFRAFLERVGG